MAKSKDDELFKRSLGPKRWENIKTLKDQKNLEEDLVVFRDGSYIRGEIHNIPSLNYPFGTINFEKHEIAAILLNPDSEHKARYITQVGENYSQRKDLEAITFTRTEYVQINVNGIAGKSPRNRKQNIELILDLDNIDYIILRKRGRIKPLINDAFYTLRLNNGDRFPIIPFSPLIHLGDNWEEFTIAVNNIINIEHTRGGLQGYLKGESIHKKLNYSILKDTHLTVSLAKNMQKLVIPWKWIQRIQGNEGPSVINTSYFEQEADHQEENMVYVLPGYFYLGSKTHDTTDRTQLPQVKGGQYFTKFSSEHIINKPQLLSTIESPSIRINMPGFFIDKYEVTNEEYYKFVTETGHPMPLHWEDLQYPTGAARHPVVNVSNSDAEAYAKWAGKRLPTELEWERAAKGISSFPYPYGPYYDPSLSNTESTSTKEVGSFEHLSTDLTQYPKILMPKAQDLSGNIREWTSSSYTPHWYSKLMKNKLYWATKDRSSTPYKVVRGGAFNSSSRTATTTYRTSMHKSDLNNYTGFRCVKDIPSG